MTATSIQDMPEQLLTEVRKLGYDLYSEVLPSAVGLPVQTDLSSEDWDAEARRLVNSAFSLGKART